MVRGIPGFDGLIAIGLNELRTNGDCSASGKRRSCYGYPAPHRQDAADIVFSAKVLFHTAWRQRIAARPFIMGRLKRPGRVDR